MNVADKEVKAERIEIRVTPNVKALLQAAAQSRHTTISEFLLTHGIAAAEQEVAMPRVFYASEAGWAGLQKLLAEDEAVVDADTVAWLTARR